MLLYNKVTSSIQNIERKQKHLLSALLFSIGRMPEPPWKRVKIWTTEKWNINNTSNFFNRKFLLQNLSIWVADLWEYLTAEYIKWIIWNSCNIHNFNFPLVMGLNHELIALKCYSIGCRISRRPIQKFPRRGWSKSRELWICVISNLFSTMALVLSVNDFSNLLGSRVHWGGSSGTCICPINFTKTRGH